MITPTASAELQRTGMCRTALPTGARLFLAVLWLFLALPSLEGAVAPVITSLSATPITGVVGSPFTTFWITATNSPSTYGATGLPAGLSVSATDGAITGTPTSTGTFSVTQSAMNLGGSGFASLTITIYPPAPVITSGDAVGYVGVPFTYQITATNGPTSYIAAGLPPGLSVSSTDGAITGIPTSATSAIVDLEVYNPGYGGAAVYFTISVPPPAPFITSATTATATVGAAFSYVIAATNSPTSYGATGLPAGLTVNATSGAITGTVTSATTASVTISASNVGGTGTATLTLTVNPPAPVITSATAATATVGTPYSYTITGTNGPTSFAATNLPAGLAVSATAGTITGTPTGATIASVTISASNAGGTGISSLTLTVNPPPPVVTSATAASAQVGQPFAFTITATNGPTSFAATNLPAGLAVNAITGAISGVPNAAGSATATVTASNAGGHGTASLAIIIVPAAPVVTSATAATAEVGQAFTYSITATNSPTSYAATNLPSGLAVNATTGAITGVPTDATIASVIVSAANAGGAGTATLTLTVNPPPPVITSAATATATAGTSFTYAITATNSPTSFAATGLPTGVSINTTTGLISGAIPAPGTYTVTVTASNAGGTGTSTVTVTIPAGLTTGGGTVTGGTTTTGTTTASTTGGTTTGTTTASTTGGTGTGSGSGSGTTTTNGTGTGATGGGGSGGGGCGLGSGLSVVFALGLTCVRRRHLRFFRE